MDKSNSIILKFEHSTEAMISREGMKINKISSSISPLTLIKLIKEADNQINPRTATANSITRAIFESLETAPEMFWLKTKGILLATETCDRLERDRLRLTFHNPAFEGIMDGGHNTFAIARFIVNKLFSEEKILFKDWEACKKFWDTRYDEIVGKFTEHQHEPTFRFSIPVEIIFPSDDEQSREEYYTCISEICSARNSNVQLKETAKGNQTGRYDYLKERLEHYPIIWKTGEKGEIPAEQVIALACLPLYFLQKKGLLPKGLKTFNIVSLYSGKNNCVTFFNDVIAHPEVSTQEHGKYIIHNTLVKSALDMTEDLMKTYDNLYVSFPDMYNKNQGSFGRINCVNNDVRSTGKFKTTQVSIPYDYPDGFIIPILGGMYALMEHDKKNEVIRWRVNPTNPKFDIKALPLEKYVGWLKKDLDPQHTGKNNLMYQEAEEAYNNYMLKNKL